MKVLAGRYFGQKGIVALIEGLPVGLLAKRTKKVARAQDHQSIFCHLFYFVTISPLSSPELPAITTPRREPSPQKNNNTFWQVKIIRGTMENPKQPLKNNSNVRSQMH